jgi:peroxiredoxin
VSELQGLGATLTELGDAGVQILAVSPDPNEKSQELAERLRARYRFLTDRDLALTRRYGLVHARGGPDGGDVPIPTTIVIDRAGIVRWLSIADNYQVRPDPAEVARAVRALRSP